MADIDFDALDDLVIPPSEPDPELNKLTTQFILEHCHTPEAEEAARRMKKFIEQRRREATEDEKRQSA